MFQLICGQAGLCRYFYTRSHEIMEIWNCSFFWKLKDAEKHTVFWDVRVILLPSD